MEISSMCLMSCSCQSAANCAFQLFLTCAVHFLSLLAFSELDPFCMHDSVLPSVHTLISVLPHCGKLLCCDDHHSLQIWQALKQSPQSSHTIETPISCMPAVLGSTGNACVIAVSKHPTTCSCPVKISACKHVLFLLPPCGLLCSSIQQTSMSSEPILP